MKTEQVLPVYQSRFLNMMEASFVDEAGNHKKWVFAQRPKNTKAVFIVPMIYVQIAGAKTCQPELRVIVIKEYRVPANGYIYSFPAGLMDVTDNLVIDTAHRELKEETGLVIKKVIFKTPFLYSSPGLSDEQVCFVYAEVEGTLTKNNQESSEDINFLILNQKDIKKLLLQEEIGFDSKAYFILRHFADTGEL